MEKLELVKIVSRQNKHFIIIIIIIIVGKCWF